MVSLGALQVETNCIVEQYFDQKLSLIKNKIDYVT